MDNGPSKVSGALPPALYWRRRVIALSAGIGLLALFAWAVNGTLSGGPAAGQASSGHSAGGSYHGHSPPGPPTGPQAVSTASSASSPPQATPAAGSRGGSSARHRGTGRSRPTASPPSSQHRRPAAACAPRDIKLRIFTPRYWYKRDQRPEFAVAVTSTASRACTFNTGARSVSLRIKGPHGRTWDSSDCVHGHASKQAVLANGMPALVWFSWGRKESSPGCHFSHHNVHPGTYMATAIASGQRSKPTIFVLGTHGIAVP